MSCENTKFDGDVVVGRHITLGGGINAHGDSVFEKGLKVKGWLDARNIRGAGKGLFATEEDLNKAYPNPPCGWWALVGNTFPADMYMSVGHQWHSTGTSVEFTGDFQLDAYLTKDEAEDTYGGSISNIEYLLKKGLISPTTMTFTAQPSGGFLQFDYTNTNGITQRTSVPIGAVTNILAGLMTPALLQELRDSIADGDNTNATSIATLDALVSRLIQPFGGFVEVDSSNILQSSSSSRDGQVMFNKTTGTFVYMVTSTIGGLIQSYQYYSNWIGSDWDESVSFNGRVPSVKKIYTSNNTCYKWNGAEMIVIAGGVIDKALSESSENAIANSAVASAISAVIATLQKDYVTKDELPSALDEKIEAVIDDETDYPDIV